MKSKYDQWVYLDSYLKYLEDERKSPKTTITTYENALKRFFNFTESRGIISVAKLTRRDVKDFMVSLKDLKPATINNYVTAIKEMWDYLIDLEIITSNIVSSIKRPKIDQTVIKYLEIDEAIAFLNESKSYGSEYEIVNHRVELMAHMFLLCGLRINEMAHIKVEDIRGNRLTVSKGKGGKERRLTLNKKLLELIDKYMTAKKEENIESEWLFNSRQNSSYTNKNERNRISVSQIRVDMLKLLDRVQRDDLTPHDLRKSFATIKIREKNITARGLQQLLGHSSIVTTTIYFDAINEELENAMENSSIL